MKKDPMFLLFWYAPLSLNYDLKCKGKFCGLKKSISRASRVGWCNFTEFQGLVNQSRVLSSKMIKGSSSLYYLQLLTASGMDGVNGPPAQWLVTKGNRLEGDLNQQQNTVELNAMANLWTQKFVTRCPVVSFCTCHTTRLLYHFYGWFIEEHGDLNHYSTNM